MHRIALLCVAVCLVATASATAQFQFTEDFTTATYQDTVATTVDWNTSSGQLGLPPFAPTLVGSTSLGPGYGYAICLQGDLAYVATSFAPVQVVDVTDPAAPVVIGQTAESGDYFDIDVSGQHLVVAQGSDGFRLFDITNPVSPTMLVNVDTSGFTNAVDLEGDRLYLSEGSGGIAIYDVSNPSSPLLLAQVGFPDTVTDVHVEGDALYCAVLSGGVQVLDVQDPSNLSVISAAGVGISGAKLDVDGDLVAVGRGVFGVELLDFSDPLAPVVVGSAPGYANTVCIQGDLLAAADGFDGLQLYDIADPTAPSLIAIYDTPAGVSGLALAGDLAYVSGAAATGLRVVRVAQAVEPVFVGEQDWGTAGYIFDATIFGDALLLGRDAGLQVLDVTDPTAPTPRGLLPETTDFRDISQIEAHGDLAYVATQFYGVHVVDISDLDAPSIVSRYASTYALDVSIEGDLLAVANRFDGLTLLDASDPTALTHIATLDFPTAVMRVEVVGDVVWMFESRLLHAVDVSNPAAPTLLSTLSTQLYDNAEIIVDGNRLYTYDRYGGLAIVDVTNPATPNLVARYDIADDDFAGLAVEGNTVALIDGFYQRVHLVDVTDPTTPVEIDRYQMLTGALSRSVAMAGGTVYRCTTQDRVQIHQTAQSAYDVQQNVAQSLSVASATDPITRVRLTAEQVGDVIWDISATGGQHWQEVPADSTWTDLTEPGTDLRWRATTAWGAVVPEVSSLGLEWEESASTDVSPALRRVLLEQNAPNPFNPVTTIRFELPRSMDVSLTVHDLRGRLVKTLGSGTRGPGAHEAVWRGTDDAGRAVASGVYTYVLTTELGDARRKLVLVR